MSKAEERALEKFPVDKNDTLFMRQATEKLQDIFALGYEQAEKDLALTWEDMKLIHEISEDFWEPKWCDDKDKEKAGYEEVLRRFNKRRNK